VRVLYESGFAYDEDVVERGLVYRLFVAFLDVIPLRALFRKDIGESTLIVSLRERDGVIVFPLDISRRTALL